MPKLYEHPLSPYVQKVKLALMEKGIAFETEIPDILSGGSAEFAATNPRLEIPALIDGDIKVFDSTIILEYLEDKWPQPPSRWRGSTCCRSSSSLGTSSASIATIAWSG